MTGLGLVWAGWIYFMSRAYRVAQALAIAPFEYVSLPINIMWGFLIWQEIPTVMNIAGAILTLLSGLYVLYRERKQGITSIFLNHFYNSLKGCAT